MFLLVLYPVLIHIYDQQQQHPLNITLSKNQSHFICFIRFNNEGVEENNDNETIYSLKQEKDSNSYLIVYYYKHAVNTNNSILGLYLGKIPQHTAIQAKIFKRIYLCVFFSLIALSSICLI